MANFNINKVIIGGRIAGDFELKKTQTGLSVTSFSIAVNRRTKNSEESKADFVSVTAWRNTAEFITQYFRKGSSICIVGSLQNRNWTDNDGKKHYETEVVVDEAYFVDSKKDNGFAPPVNANPASVPENVKMEEISDDEDLPF